MPTRDEEAEARREQIVDAALDVFSRKGYEGATTKDIAEAAGVKSPGLIYHYFKDKEHLFEQVIERNAPILAVIREPESFLALPPREALLRVALAFLAILDQRAAMPMVRLLLSEAVRRPKLAEVFNTLGPRRLFALVSTYLERQMAAGTLRRMDVGAAVRCFMGPLIIYILTHEVFPQPDTVTLDSRTMAETAVEIFLRGMEPAAVAPRAV
jgi:AcrR family transcriptional regulator